MANKSIITGSFIDEITYDIPSSNWSKKQWSDDLDNMLEVGMDTLIFIRGGFKNRTIFPSKNFEYYKNYDFLGFILDEANKRGMNVYIGLYMTDIDWGHGDIYPEIEINKKFIKEVMERYGQKKAFTGWYLPHEVSCNILNIGRLTNALSKLCKDIAPEKKVMISPFFRTSLTDQWGFSFERYFDEWDNLFNEFGEDIDICAYQDGSSPLNDMVGYFKQAKLLCDKYNIHLWSNCETFERDVRCQYYPIPFDILCEKLKRVGPYVEKIITFEFSHFLSPQSIYPSARNLFNLYKEYIQEEQK